MEASVIVVAPPPGRAPSEESISPEESPRPVPVIPRERAPASTPASSVEGAGVAEERSRWLDRALEDGDAGAIAARAGIGLALTLPFGLAAALRTDVAPGLAAVAILSLPVGLALVALVGVAASTLGVSLVSAPLEPRVAASLASHGLFRTGLVLAGLAPLTGLFVASGAMLEALFVSTLSVLAAGIAGIGTIARGMVVATEEDGAPRIGALVVSTVFVLFALVVGLRVWAPVLDVLLPSIFGEP